MYLRGLKSLGDDYDSFPVYDPTQDYSLPDPAPAPAPGAIVIGQGSTPPTPSGNWSSWIAAGASALKTWKGAPQPTQPTVANRIPPALYPRPGYSPFPAAGAMGMGGTVSQQIIPLAAIAGGAYLLWSALT